MNGIDVSFSKITPQWVANRKSEGYTIFVQCAWTGGMSGNDGIKAVCEHNLRTAREGGMQTYIYINASPEGWWPVSTQVHHIVTNCGSEWPHLADIFMDVEIVWQGQYVTPNRAIELQQAMIQLGKECEVLYTAAWYWNQLPTRNDPRWYDHFPLLWNAFYDSNPDIDFGTSPYGEWQLDDLIGEQYQNTTIIEGVAVDLNSFSPEYFEEDNDMNKAEVMALLQDPDLFPELAGRSIVAALQIAAQAATNVDLETDPMIQQWPGLVLDVEAIKSAVETPGDGSHTHV